jgi:hypothetical protein
VLERISASGTRRCRWTGLLVGLAILGSSPCRAEGPPVKLSILGVPDGQIKLSADTAAVALTLGVEASGNKDISATIRISPLRDASGHLHPLELSADSGLASQAAGPGTRAELPIVIPAGRVVTFRVAATLAATGQYTGDISFLHGSTRDTAQLSVTRAARELGVEIQGIQPLRAVAAVGGDSYAQLRIVLQETAGRPVTLDAPIVTEFSRREANGGRGQASQRLLIGIRDPGPLTLAANQSLPLSFILAELEGAGEYQGKLRIGARGARPVDADFTVTLRQPASAAFMAILIGVGISIALRFLSESVRPRLVEMRRAQWLLLELERMLQEARDQQEEIATIRSLHREVSALLLTLELGTMEPGVREQLDRLSERRKLTNLWIYWRRRVAGLVPSSLRGKFQGVIVSVRGVISSADSNVSQIEQARQRLQGLDALIETELRRQLTAHIEALRKSIEAAVASRPEGAIAGSAGILTARLGEARNHLGEDNVPAALDIYTEVSAKWAEILVDDLMEIIGAGAPPGVAPDRWAVETDALRTQLAGARAAVSSNVEQAMASYQEAWARYTRLIGAGLKRHIEALRTEAAADQDLDRDERDTVVSLIQGAESQVAAALTAASAANTQDTLTQLLQAERATLEAERRLHGDKRGAMLASEAAPLKLPIDLPPLLADAHAGDRVVTREDLRINVRQTRAIDAVLLVVTVLVTTVLGLITLWSPDATWGGWEDWIMAMLWGLGLHQFTFAGVANLRERLTGQRTSVAVSS